VTSFGVHTGVQNTTVDELRALWSDAEQLGFDGVSVWDHFYSSDLASAECLEAVAMHTALACATTSVRCGCLVYCAGYRSPAVLAKAVTAIDLLSGGRAEIGLGAGWADAEYAAFGIPYPPLGQRLDLLAETAAAVRSLLRHQTTDLDGTHVRLTAARNEPRPRQPALPVWIGGTGERRTARIVAEHGDGWNLPFVPPGALPRKREVLTDHCRAVGRDPDEVRLGVNVIVCDDDTSLAAQFGPRTEAVRPGALVGTSVDQLADGLGRYVAAGADTVNVALRAPWDPDAHGRAAAAVAQLRGGAPAPRG
jgi:alkanesulfonate monooxygenase SsuD/methylene tetrahydromethanopterin reductase-like flavin-dependent oxidoreductase (luciferase family)